MINKGAVNANATVYFGNDWIAGADFFPVLYDNCTVRDLGARRDLGVFNGSYTVLLEPHDAVLLLVRSL